jgi:hypothetical protein
MVVKLPSNGKQAPTTKPSATAPDRTSPQGISIDFQIAKLMLTKLAFWTDTRAIRTIQTAAIAETTRLTMSVQRVKIIKIGNK